MRWEPTDVSEKTKCSIFQCLCYTIILGFHFVKRVARALVRAGLVWPTWPIIQEDFPAEGTFSSSMGVRFQSASILTLNLKRAPCLCLLGVVTQGPFTPASPRLIFAGSILLCRRKYNSPVKTFLAKSFQSRLSCTVFYSLHHGPLLVAQKNTPLLLLIAPHRSTGSPCSNPLCLPRRIALLSIASSFPQKTMGVYNKLSDPRHKRLILVDSVPKYKKSHGGLGVSGCHRESLASGLTTTARNANDVEFFVSRL